MTEAKPAEFAKGDKVTSKDGVQLVVVNQSSPGSAVQAESAPGVKPYTSTFYAADSLKKAGIRKPKPKDEPAKAPEQPTDQGPGDYLFKFQVPDGEAYEIAVEGAESEAAAVDAALNDEAHVEGSNLMTGEKV